MAISVNWNEHTSASPIGVLSGGLHSATITGTKFFENDGRLYYYMTTDDNGASINHRESFSLPRGFGYLRAMVESAGAPSSVFKKNSFDENSIVGKDVYFHYTPPEQVTDDGRPAEGCYPRYVFYTKARWAQLKAIQNARFESVEETEAASKEELDFDSN